MWAWVSGGAGVVFLAGAAVALVVELNAVATIHDECATGACATDEMADSLNTRKNLGLGLAIAFGVVGVAGVGTGVYGIATTPSARRDGARVGLVPGRDSRQPAIFVRGAF
jgi:hypothetical protein